jgi:hypothetical protein
MAILRSDATALEHILVVLLEQPVQETGSPVPPFRACFLVAGCLNAIDFVSITPDTYGAVEFSINSDGTDATVKLNIIQIKKLRSLIAWYSQVPSASASRWFDLDATTFRAWRTQSVLNPTPTTVVPPAPASSSTISDFRKGVKRDVSSYKPFKDDKFFNAWQRSLTIIMLTMLST